MANEANSFAGPTMSVSYPRESVCLEVVELEWKRKHETRGMCRVQDAPWRALSQPITNTAGRLTQFKPSNMQLYLLSIRCASSCCWAIYRSPGWHQRLLRHWVDVVHVDRTASGPFNVQGWRCPWVGAINRHLGRYHLRI